MDVEMKNITFAKTVKLRIGIFDEQLVKTSEVELRRLAGIQVNKKGTKDWERGGQKYSTADFFKSIWQKTNIEKKFTEIWAKKSKQLVTDCLTDGKERMALNSSTALMKQGYMAMSKENRNSKKRIEQKKHDNYAFGNGQTYEDLKSQLIKDGKIYKTGERIQEVTSS